MHLLSLHLLILLLLPLSGWGNDVPLFAIQRSKNVNTVQYYLRVDDRCHLASHTRSAPSGNCWQRALRKPNR